jgi:hypothetical protein
LTAPARSAVLKALHTTEILELILSHVPAFDLIAAANVNEFFYNCAVNSPNIQQTLFLRPSANTTPQCYRVHRSWIGSNGKVATMTTIGLTPSAGMSNNDIDQWAERCTAVRLCPALCPMDEDLLRRENIAAPTDDLRKLRRNGNQSSRFTVGPNEVRSLDMFVCDPPVTGASIFLCYRHVVTSAMAFISYTTSQDSQLTFNSIFEGAWSATNGCVGLVEGADVGNLGSTRAFDSTLDAVTSEYIKTHGGSFELDHKVSWIKLNVIVPTEEEWETMHQVLAEEEEKKKTMSPGHHAAWMAQLLRER